MNTEPTRIWPPLPCAIRAGDGLCGKPAEAGYVWRQSEQTNVFYTPGLWLLQPVCKNCSKAMLDNLVKEIDD